MLIKTAPLRHVLRELAAQGVVKGVDVRVKQGAVEPYAEGGEAVLLLYFYLPRLL